MGHNRQILRERLQILSEALLCLETLNEYEHFLNDILTIPEIEMIAQRFQVAMKLSEGKTFKEISKELGVSSVTIERVKQSFHYGEDGYKIAIERLKGNADERNAMK